LAVSIAEDAERLGHEALAFLLSAVVTTILPMVINEIMLANAEINTERAMNLENQFSDYDPGPIRGFGHKLGKFLISLLQVGTAV